MIRTKLVLLFLIINVACLGQDADSIINGYIRFIGGAEKWKSIRSMVAAGSYNYGGIEFPFTTYAVAPNKYKVIVSANGKSFMQAYNGSIGWKIDGFNNETTKTILADSLSKKLMNEANVELEDPLIDYKQKGHTITLLGTEKTDSSLVYKLELIKKDGTHEMYFVNTTNFAIVQKQAVSKNAELDNSLLNIYYSNYKNFDGILLPGKTVTKAGDQTILTIVTEVVRLNEPIAGYIFDL